MARPMPALAPVMRAVLLESVQCGHFGGSGRSCVVSRRLFVVSMRLMLMDAELLVEAKGLVKEYPREGGATRVVDGRFVFRYDEARRWGLVGESGSGKSTVARMILRLD